MSAPSSLSLAELQRWLRAAVMPADGGSEAHAADGEPGAGSVGVDDVVRGSAGQSAAERLAVYRRGYIQRLLECMRAAYPGLRHALGTELFDEFAVDYLRAHPSRSYTLQNLGQLFPDHLSSTRPDSGSSVELDEPWPDFIVDLARLERLVTAIYDGPGLEDGPAGYGAVVPEVFEVRWAEATVEPAPSLRLLESTYPVGRYLLSYYRGDSPTLPLPEPEFLALGRRHYVVRLHELPQASFIVLTSLSSGATLGAAAQHAAVSTDRRAWGWFRDWVVAGLFAHVSVPAPSLLSERRSLDA